MAARPARGLRQWPAGRRLLVGAGLLSAFTVSDGFLYLQLAQRDALAARWFPLLLVGTNVSYLLLALPLGTLSDRIGRAKVLLAGHAALVVAYAFVAGPVGGLAGAAGCLLMLGAYYAATDGVLAATAGQLAGADVRARGIAGAQTVVAVARAGAAVAFGALWTRVGRETALWTFTGLLVVAIPLAALLLRDLVAEEPS